MTQTVSIAAMITSARRDKSSMKLDFGSGYNPRTGYKTCDCTGNPMLDYHFDKDNYRIECPAEQFRSIRLMNVVHHVKDVKKLFIELLRVLKPEGRLVIIEPTQKAYPVNVFLDTLWYRSIIPRQDIWYSLQYRDFISTLTDLQIPTKVRYCREKQIVIGYKI